MKIEKTGWYKSKSIVGWLAFIDLEKYIIYGFNENGSWFLMNSILTDFYGIEPATEQEATERLKAEAIKRGYVEGAEVVSLYSLLLETIEGIDYVFGNAGFFAGSTVIMKHGKWARITKPAEQPQEKTFPRMMEIKSSYSPWEKAKIEILWDGKAWENIGSNTLFGHSIYREIESNEKADKIAELEEEFSIGEKVVIDIKDFEYKLLAKIVYINNERIATLSVIFEGSKIIVYRTLTEIQKLK